MSSNTATGALASQTVSDESAAVRRKAAEKCQFVLEALYDSFNGYKQCAADTKDTAMRLLFDKIAASRADLIIQLSNVIRVDLGVEPVTSGSALAGAHRTWIDVKSWFTDGRDKAAIVTEVHRGENVLIKLYETAIEDPDIVLKVRDFLHEQLKTVKEQNASVDVFLLPDVKSPNLWPVKVKCRIEEEKQTALLLVRKYFALENNEKTLQIKSVVVKESDRGYIYIEAFKSNHIKAACEDIRSLNVSNLQMLPIKGMTDILRVVKTTYRIKKKGSWVHVKRGIYRDDLAKVKHCDMIQNMVTLKLIPRIDYTKKRGELRRTSNDQSDIVPEQHQGFKKKNCFAFKRLPAKLFDETAVESAAGQI
ncbi:unnamed protein product [Rotaria sp. Silwood2]|nr:unnamed protein product [Rotaria sp. Silwood2]